VGHGQGTPGGGGLTLTRIALASALLASLVLPTLAQEPAPSPTPPAPEAPSGETYELRPLYKKGDRQEVEARVRLNLRIRLQVPSAKIDRTSEQEQVIVRRYKDELLTVQDGKVAEVRREFLEDWEGTRLPGAQTLEREPTPLHHRTIVVGLDAEGKREVRPPEGVTVPKSILETELHTERYEAVLPQEPVAVGATWVVEGKRLERALSGLAGEDSEGKIECTFVEIREEAVDEETPADRFAIVKLALKATGKQGDDEEDPTLSTSMEGELRFSLARRKIVTVDLEGTARLEQVRKDGDVTATVDGRGPIEIHKRMWFPSADEQR
jgi:hypothetical protein